MKNKEEIQREKDQNSATSVALLLHEQFMKLGNRYKLTPLQGALAVGTFASATLQQVMTREAAADFLVKSCLSISIQNQTGVKADD